MKPVARREKDYIDPLAHIRGGLKPKSRKNRHTRRRQDRDNTDDEEDHKEAYNLFSGKAKRYEKTSYTTSSLSSNRKIQSIKGASLQSTKSSGSHSNSSSLLSSGSKPDSDSTASLRSSKQTEKDKPLSKHSSAFPSSSYSSRRSSQLISGRKGKMISQNDEQIRKEKRHSSYSKSTSTQNRSPSSTSTVSTSSLPLQSSHSPLFSSGFGGTEKHVQNLESESDIQKRTEQMIKRHGVEKNKANKKRVTISQHYENSQRVGERNENTAEVLTSQNNENKDIGYPLSPLQKIFGTCMDFEDTTNVQLINAKIRMLGRQLQQVDLQRRPGLVWLLETTMWRLKRKLGQSYPHILSSNRSNCLPLFPPLIADDAPVLARKDNPHGLQDEYIDLVTKQRLKARLNTNFECIMNNLSTLSQTPTKGVCEYQSCFRPNVLSQSNSICSESICSEDAPSEHQQKCLPCFGQSLCADPSINQTLCLSCPSQDSTCASGLFSLLLPTLVNIVFMRTKSCAGILKKSSYVLFAWSSSSLQNAYKISCVFTRNSINQIPMITCIVQRRVYDLICRVLTTTWYYLLRALSWLHCGVSWSLTSLVVAMSLLARGWGSLPQLVTPFVDELSNFSQNIQTECDNSTHLPSACRQKQTDVIQAFRAVRTDDDLLIEQTTVQRKQRSRGYTKPNPKRKCAGAECGSWSDDQELIDICVNKLSVKKQALFG